MESSFDKITQIFTTCKSILEIYWINKQFDPTILTDLMPTIPIDSLINYAITEIYSFEVIVFN
jgi:hypothetical protein